jgi:hypothetical protein
LFIIYINDLCELCDEYANIFLFADDAKIYNHIKSSSDHSLLQRACDEISKWSDKWLLPLNASKCVLLRIGRGKDKENIDNSGSYEITVKNTTSTLSRVNSTKDLGIVVDDALDFKEHTQGKINKAFSMLGIIKRNFRHMDKHTFVKIYKTMVRSHLEYAVSAWAPHLKGLVNDIERVQRRATKLVRQCQNMSYKERLIYLNLPTLSYRRVRGDMIEVYKILTNKVDSVVIPNLELYNCTKTRGNVLKLSTSRAKYDLRKYFFSIRVTSVWNSLPDTVVNAGTVNIFKNALDRHWKTEEILFDYKANLSGTGVRGLNI